ncbi:MAG: LacI family DNA-binding transcriptional regulator [Terracidiphilus sp.]
MEKSRAKFAGAALAGGGKRAPRRQLLRQPSIKDIARLAGVSHPTVSRALRDVGT